MSTSEPPEPGRGGGDGDPPSRRRSTQRLDTLLCARGLAETRSQAQALIMAGRVLVDEHTATKAGAATSIDAALRLKASAPYVSRGGEKLDVGLDHFAWRVVGDDALDVGASTGGFTDCLLSRGVHRVCCIDVGYGQLHHRLRQDPRVSVRERTNARFLAAGELPFAPNLVVADVSFISLTLILEPVLGAARRPWRALVLVKPQFEAGRDHVGRGGVVTDPLIRAGAVARVARYALSLDAAPLGAVDTGLPGPAGNHEYLLALASSDHQLGRLRPRPDPDQLGRAATGATAD